MMKNRSTLPLMAPKRPMAPPPPSPRPPRPQQCVAMTARATIVPLPLPRRLPLARPAEAPVTLPVTPPVTPPVPNNSELSVAEHADGIARMSDELRATVEKKDAPLLELIQTIDRDVAKLVALAIRRDDPLERRMSIHDMGVEVKTSLALLAFDTARAGAVYRESVRSLSNGLAQAVEQITSDDALTQSLMERLEERENEVKLLRAQLEMKELKQSKERTDSSCSSRDSMTDTSDATDANVVSDESASFTEDAADDKRQSSVSAVLDASVDVGCGVDGAVAVTADAAADPVAVRQADQVSPASIDAQIEYYLSFLHDEDDAWVLPATQEPDVCSSTKTSKISSIAPVATQSEPVSNARASRILQPKIQVPSSLKQRVPGQALGAVTAASSSPSGMSCSRRSILPPGWAVAHIVRSKAAHQTTRSRSKTAPTSRSPVCGKQTNAMVVPAVASASKNPIRKSRRKVAAPTQMENRQPWR